MINILYVIDKVREAGAQKHLFDVISELDKASFQCNLITLEELGVKRIYGASGIMAILKLVKLMRKEKYEIIHTYLFSANIIGSIAAKLAGIKTVITSRRDTGLLREGRWQHILASKLTNRWVDKIICVSKAVKKVVLAKEKVNPQKIEVIYNGVDLEKFQVAGHRSQIKESLGIKKDEFVVGMIANFSWIKGHKDFIQAAQVVLKELSNTRFLLIGSGPLIESLRSQVSGLRLEEKVLFLGTRKDIPELLSVMDVSVNASYSEGMSNTILQSMAAGVPVVVTAVDGNLETVDDGKTGILVSAGKPQEIAEAIIRLLENRDLAKEMGINAQKRISEKFTAQIMISNMENLYKKLLAPKIAYVLSQFPETHETFILREIKALEEKGVNIKILSLKPCRDKVIHPEAVELMGKTVYGVISVASLMSQVARHPIKTGSTFLYIIATYWKNPKNLTKAIYVWLECLYFVRIIKKERIAHIHSHWATMPTTAAMILSKLTRIPFSFTAHAWDIFVNCDGLEEKIEKSRFVTTCTDYNRKFLSYFCRDGKFKKVYLNYHGVDIDRFSVAQLPSCPVAQTQEKCKILAIGRLVETKGFEYLIKACLSLKDRGLDFECDIVGEGPLEKSLRSQVSSLKLESKINFLGIIMQEEIKKLFSEATVLVQSSVTAKNGDRDGIPNVILEAMAMGVPVIATDFSGIPEVIIDGKTGILVPEKDTLTLANAIERIYKDSSFRQIVSLNGRRLIEERFNTDKNIAELINIFQINGVLN